MKRCFNLQNYFSKETKSMVGMKNPETDYIGILFQNKLKLFKTINLDIDSNNICMNSDQRKVMELTVGSKVYIEKYIDDISECKSCIIVIESLIEEGKKHRILKEELDQIKTSYLINIPIFTNLEIKVNVSGTIYILNFSNFQENTKITENTIIKFYTKNDDIALENNNFGENTYSKYLEQKEGMFFKKDISNKSISESIGGFVDIFKNINRRAFNSRLISKEARNSIGLTHSKGILLYGPPGTGKTMIAKELSDMINYKDIKVVNGPEIFDKYVGSSESNIRDIFLPAEFYEDEDELLLIIFEEIDSICLKRSDSDSNVNNNVVNQLLTQIDGFKKRNNIFIIATTNRIDMIDPAILRSGRIDIHIEIGLPSKKDRLEILEVHTKKMKHLLNNVSLEKIAELTTNYSGAELRTVVTGAVNRAIDRNVDKETNQLLNDNIIINQDDFVKSVSEIKPIFNNNYEELNIIRNSNFSEIQFKPIKGKLNKIFIEINEDKNHEINSYIKNMDYDFIKYINSTISYNEYKNGYDELTNFITTSTINSALIIFDSIEDLIMFCPLDNTYSKIHLQSLFRLLTYKINSDKIITIIITSSNNHLIDKLKLKNK